MNVKIIYIANVRFPTDKAHGLQIAKTCEALSSLGASVILLVPERRNKIKEDSFTFYNVKQNFEIKKEPCRFKQMAGTYTEKGFIQRGGRKKREEGSE